MSAPVLQPYVDGLVGDVISPYVKDGVFVADFYMEGRPSAQVGASLREYLEANMILGVEGFGANGDLHTHVLGPDEPGRYWHESIRTSGDLGWNPRGAAYFWHPTLTDQQNAANWIACGRPSENIYGEWGDQGVPRDLHDWRSLSPFERDPGVIPHKYNRGPYRPNRRR